MMHEERTFLCKWKFVSHSIQKANASPPHWLMEGIGAVNTERDYILGMQ